ncbi:hypothetical protein GCM10007872_28250 [Gluconobacter sphaericus NBRC 12467]|uniref:Uncharacterized protein n=2 Tax=Gluconobacter TaxID=441 RepID=A0AA37SIF8_9PROT|nr:hypothetical protein AA3266_0906 [Gluconobacter kondonii NBRC 3266]GBR51592.1 hypothetical protein AA12467_0654 [Gluconobacter sphaericus NBRC 12467]GEB43342.1 hypothetical protein GSP01_21240 [Gluconobacter sphaericus NBRC 12467]GLQ65974.1 hypothetical protein GCM10007870_15580 [Gluconobacter kondonii]GLQ85915.1 hypothetical protein GCM10007872_28250 [Gluconobacter sphaericus NBRC 12467]
MAFGNGLGCEKEIAVIAHSGTSQGMSGEKGHSVPWQAVCGIQGGDGLAELGARVKGPCEV